MGARDMKLIYRGINYRRLPVDRESSDALGIDVKYRGVVYRISPTALTLQQSLVAYKYRGVDYTKRYY